MRIINGAWAVPAALILALAGCATADIRPGITPPEGVILEARAFPEVEVLTTGGALYICKLARLGKDTVSLLPSPYWNVETKSVVVAEIHSIRTRGQKSDIGRGVVTGFGFVSCIAGIAALGSSKYDVDYENAILGAPLVGLVIGVPLGFLVGVAGDAVSRPARYDFRELSPDRKYGVLRRLMGI